MRIYIYIIHSHELNNNNTINKKIVVVRGGVSLHDLLLHTLRLFNWIIIAREVIVCEIAAESRDASGGGVM